MEDRNTIYNNIGLNAEYDRHVVNSLSIKITKWKSVAMELYEASHCREEDCPDCKFAINLYEEAMLAE